MLRGLSREKRHWGKFPEILRARSEAQVHGLELPGTGTEWSRPSPKSIPEIMQDVRARWNTLALRPSSPRILIAISMGGMVGIEWLRTYPEDFDGLILINTSVASLSHPWQRMRLQAYPRVLAAALSRDSLAREARILRLTTRLEPAAIRETARLWSNYALEYPMKRKNFLNQLLAASRYRPDQYPKTPTLVLASMRDELVSPDCSRRLAETLGAKFLLHPDAGHDLPLEDPRWLAETVIEWSRSLTNVRFSRS